MTTKREAGTRRRRSASSYRKIAVSVPAELVQAVEAEVRARHAPSVSAFISTAVEEKLERDHLQELLDETWKKQPMTDKERAWADRLLGA
jgi:hypothetical protein